ncbi:hypothetical protein PBRA_008162 [Plasmodiophora brassicae]|nr:hypothetical protein PBRA_008162 [Plasmodiophora brassicae]
MKVVERLSRLVVEAQGQFRTAAARQSASSWLDQVLLSNVITRSSLADTMEKVAAHEELLKKYRWGVKRDNMNLCRGVARHCGLEMPMSYNNDKQP